MSAPDCARTSRDGPTAVTVQAGINIALVKYWGKRPGPGNLPAVGSLSLTLDAPGTRTTVAFDPTLDADVFTLNGEVDDIGPVGQVLDDVRAVVGLTTRARVHSHNTVPTAAGLASSASGMAALGLAAWCAAGLPHTPDDPEPRLVDLVRRGSGSAPRSLLGGFARIDRERGRVHAVPTAPGFEVSLVIGLTVGGRKSTSSRLGMRQSAGSSPYYPAWVDTHEADMAAAAAAIAAGDFPALGAVMEHSTMKMHACMLANQPPLRYWAPRTLVALDALGPLREQGRAFATMDAGPHVKALCRREDEAVVAEVLRQALGDVLIARPGRGARLVDEPVLPGDARPERV